MLKTASFFIFLFLLSCTVTKRVHRPGYHIEWKKNYRVQKGDTPVESDANGANEPILVCASNELPVSSEIDVELSVEAKNTSETIATNLTEEREDEAEMVERKQPEKHIYQRTFQRVKSRNYFPIHIPFVSKKKKASNEYVSDGFRTVGFVLLGLGGFLLMGSLLSYFGFWLLEELFYSLVFSGNGFFAGLLGFILFLIILIVVFLAYAIVRYVLGGSYVGFIVSFICIGGGLLSLLIATSF